MKIFATLLVCGLLTSCKYQEIADAPYPDQVIYMPAAVRGIYDISVVVDTYNNPTPGSPTRYSIDSTGNKVIVPLAVYRAGVSNDGTFSVNIAINPDTVGTLITDGTLNGVELLPANQYNIPSSIVVNAGKESASFDLDIKLDFLQANIGKVYAVAVEISSSERAVNPLYKTTIVLINTSILE